MGLLVGSGDQDVEGDVEAARCPTRETVPSSDVGEVGVRDIVSAFKVAPVDSD